MRLWSAPAASLREINDSGCSRIVTGGRGRDGSEGGVSRAAEARGRHGHGYDGFGVNHISEEATERSPAPSYYSCNDRGSGVRGPDQRLGWSPEICSSRESWWVSFLSKFLYSRKIWLKMADGVGFEPTVSLHPRRFSRPVP